MRALSWWSHHHRMVVRDLSVVAGTPLDRTRHQEHTMSLLTPASTVDILVDRTPATQPGLHAAALDPVRLRRALKAYTTRFVAPRAGDVVLARVTEIGKHTRLESEVSRRQLLFPGQEILVAYGDRYAPDQFLAHSRHARARRPRRRWWPRLRGDGLHPTRPAAGEWLHERVRRRQGPGPHRAPEPPPPCRPCLRRRPGRAEHREPGGAVPAPGPRRRGGRRRPRRGRPHRAGGRAARGGEDPPLVAGESR